MGIVGAIQSGNVLVFVIAADVSTDFASSPSLYSPHEHTKDERGKHVHSLDRNQSLETYDCQPLFALI